VIPRPILCSLGQDSTGRVNGKLVADLRQIQPAAETLPVSSSPANAFSDHEKVAPERHGLPNDLDEFGAAELFADTSHPGV